MCSKWQVLCVLWLFVSDTCFLNTAMKGGEIFVQKLSPSTFRSSSPALLRGKFFLPPWTSSCFEVWNLKPAVPPTLCPQG